MLIEKISPRLLIKTFKGTDFNGYNFLYLLLQFSCNPQKFNACPWHHLEKLLYGNLQAAALIAQSAPLNVRPGRKRTAYHQATQILVWFHHSESFQSVPVLIHHHVQKALLLGSLSQTMCERLALLLWIQWRILWISSKETNVRISLLWLVLASVLPVEYLTSGNWGHVLYQVPHHGTVKHFNLFTSSYSTTTQTGALGRRLSNHNIFWKQKILLFFLQMDQ